MKTINENYVRKLEDLSCDIEQVIKVINIFMEFCTTEGFLDGCSSGQEKAVTAIVFTERANMFRSILYTAEQTLCKDMAELDEVIEKGIQNLKQVS